MIRLKGAYTALVTPFTAEDALDQEGLRTLIDLQIKAGIDGIVVMGSTGESPTLSSEERQQIVQITRETLPKEIPLIVGTGHSSTKQTIANTLQAEKLGADMALVVAPYYNKPTPEGVYQHYSTLARATSLPLIVYNSPGRTGTQISVETAKRLVSLPSIVGMKESSGNISHTSDMIEMVRQERPEFSILTGDDPLTLATVGLGGQGVISVISNLLPDLVKALVWSTLEDDMSTAQELHYFLMPLIRALFLESNPIPIKAALALQGLPGGKCRLPLCEMQPENHRMLEIILEPFGSPYSIRSK